MHPGMGMYEIAPANVPSGFAFVYFGVLFLGGRVTKKCILWRERRDMIVKLLFQVDSYTPSRCLV
jgi:hypothetical protein